MIHLTRFAKFNKLGVPSRELDFGHVHHAADAFSLLDKCIGWLASCLHRPEIGGAYMHVVESFLDLLQVTVVSYVLVDEHFTRKVV